MTKRKLYTTFGTAVLLIASMAQGFAYMQSTIARYAHGAPCGLTGVPMLLQKAHFIAPSICKAPNNGKCSSAACTLKNPPSGQSDTGHCVAKNPGKNVTCGCVAN